MEWYNILLARNQEGTLTDAERAELTALRTEADDFMLRKAQAAGTLAMTWKDRNFREPLYMDQLSEGTLRFLWLVTLQQLSGGNRSAPSGSPEWVNHNNPPSYRIKEIFEQGKRRSYNKARDAKRILEKNNLIDAVNVCPELKAFLNTILRLCEGDEIP